MLKMLIVLEDQILEGSWNDGGWDVTVADVPEGMTEKGRWSNEQLSAVLALSIGSVGEDKTEGYDVEKLYAVAESAIVGWCPECRPFP